MHTAKHLKQVFILFVLSIYAQSYIVSQTLIPNIDQVLHLSDITELAVSLDKKYFALADNDGVVTLRDVETGKVIASEDFDGIIEDIAFSDQEGCLVVIYTWQFEGDLESDTHIEHIDFINKETLSSVEFLDTEFNGVDFNTDKNLALLTPEFGMPRLVNYFTGDTLSIPLPGDQSVSAFGSNDNCIFYNGVENNSLISVFNYDINSNTFSLEKTLNNIIGDIDLSNKLAYIDGDDIVFIDHAKSAKVSIPKADYMRDDEETIVHDFSFSPDNKHIALVGGRGTEQSMSMVGIRTSVIEHGTGFVALYQVDGNRRLWKTTNQENQPYFDVKDVGWIDDQNFIVCDERGNIFSMGSAESFYYKAFPLPRREITYADVNKDFSSIIYSQKDSPTFQFDIGDQGVREKISNYHSNRISFSDQDIKVAASSFLSPGGQINEHVLGLSKSFKYPLIIQDIFTDATLSNDGRRYAMGSDMLHAAWISMVDLPIEKIEKNASGVIQKIETPEFILMSPSSSLDNNLEALLNPENPDSIHLSNEASTVVFFLDEQSKTIVLQNLLGDLEFSDDGRYLAIKSQSLDVKTSILDLDKLEWLSPFDGSAAFLYNDFSEHHPLAFSFTSNRESIVWNTTTQEILFQGSVELEGFQPDSPVSDLFNNVSRQLELFAENISFAPNGKKVYMQMQNSLYVLDTDTGKLEDYEGIFDFINTSISPDGRYLYSEEFDGDAQRTRSILTDLQSELEIYDKPFSESWDSEARKSITGQVFFHDSKPLAFIHNSHGTFELIHLENTELIATLKFFENGEWIVFTQDGLFDGSKFGRNALYYTYGTEVILFNQIKEKYWEPDLLSKLINNPALILTDRSDKTINLYPNAELSAGSSMGDISIKLTGDINQIGAVGLYLNDKEVETDINSSRVTEMSVNILEDQYRQYLFQNDLNKVSIKTYNKEGWISSRPYTIYLNTNLAKDKGTGDENEVVVSSRRRRGSSSIVKPGLYGLFVGTSEYQNEKLNLSFADKDAKDLNAAFEKISDGLYDENRISLKTLFSKSEDPSSLATKQNILSEFSRIQEEAKPNDIIVLFFSGHGLTIDDDFYYLTSTAGKSDITTDAEERAKTCLSSSEIKENLRMVKSNKQIMILDACHSGQITKIFEDNGKATSTTLNKALENLEDKMGVYVLASSESNQKSFETEALQQGLLTFALTYGMSGEASRDNDIIDVAELLTYASKKTEDIGKEILGKSQRPVLGITQGGNPFPVGFINPELKVELPGNKLKFSEPRLFTSSFSDPKKIAKAVQDRLIARGAIGTNEDFIYMKNDLDQDAIRIAGSYKVEGTNIILEWNLLKEEDVFKGPITLTVEEGDIDIIGNLVINESLKALK